MGNKYGGGSLTEQVSGRLDLPGDVVADLPRIEVVGAQRVVVENHKGLLGYTENEVRVAGHRVSLLIRGDGLLLEAMNARELSVTGQIFGLDLIY